MFYFTKYAETKFDALNKHGVFITREMVTDAFGAQPSQKYTQKYINVLIYQTKFVKNQTANNSGLTTSRP